VQLETAIEDNQHDDFELSFQTINEIMPLLKSIEKKNASSFLSRVPEVVQIALQQR